MTYRIGLDIGIGSVGWAVVSAQEDGHPARIEDFGTRIFQSGEDEQTSQSLCSKRRGFRSVRRLEHRRSFRKKTLINHFKNIGLVNDAFNDEAVGCRDEDVYALKVSGLDCRLTPAELYKCLVHTCNHRGYRDFYEPEEDDKEAGMNESAANEFEKAYRESGKRSVSEYLLSAYPNDGFVKYRNRAGSGTYMLIRRKLLEEEADLILEAQAAYYPVLTELNRKRAHDIIFSQRDFEDGPGDPNDPDRRYHGFIESLGRCPFYQDKERGFRGTVISDVFAVTNTLSQYRFVDVGNGAYALDPGAAKAIVDFLLKNAKITMKDVKNILKERGFKLLKSENSDDKALSKSVKFLTLAKKAVEEAGLSWQKYISEEQFQTEEPSAIHKLGELLSKFQTPGRRAKELEKAGVEKSLIKTVSGKKISGTAAASYDYMCDAINAFLSGDIYGNFQANRSREKTESDPVERTYKLAPSVIDDPDIRSNRVVFKAVNETRKIINAIVDVYGSPKEIVIEVASELGKSLEMRQKETNRQRLNEKNNDSIKNEVAKLLLIEPGAVKGAMMDRYKLFIEQEGKCVYSGKTLGDIKDVVLNKDKAFEVDHVVPYSLILDNTLENKVLVFSRENQLKGQRTPLMYMGEEQAKEYLAFVNHMYSRKERPISKKKLAYCRLPSIYGADAEEILGAWKSRNINDTRYITKYVAGLLDRYLIFTGSKKQHVFSVKGSVTQKFRREWFADSVWGKEEKDRETYLNHALDALVAANLTKDYIEIGSDALRLRAIYKSHGSKITPEYDEYLEKCIAKMKKYYGFSEEYTRGLLTWPGRVPSYVSRLTQEVAARFNDSDEAAFRAGVAELYGREAPFVVPPHVPVTSQKQDKKFRGCIADSNPIRIVEIDGTPHKIKRENISALTAEKLEKLYTDDASLKEELSRILCGKKKDYSVEKYLKENGLSCFRMPNGKSVRKVSLDGGVVSNFYRKEIGNGNFTNLGMLKYYCVEVYKDLNGFTRLCGVRFVDLVNKDKKLFRKAESLPEDYGKHIMYLFANDYVAVYDGKGKKKYEGYYKSVANIVQSNLYMNKPNEKKTFVASISKKDVFKKRFVGILGKLGGEIKCSEPLQCIREKKSR